MFTIFSTPKPFKGHIKIIQTNAIRSWVSLRPECEVILFGDEEGTAELASEVGIRHITGVECNEYGTPLVSSMFNIAQDIATHKLMCYVNADIILMSDFLEAVHKIEKGPFLLVGRRWDIDLDKSLDFSDPGWETKLQSYVNERGRLHGISGIDYFVFPKGLYRDNPPFAIGRPGWDNWMIYQARHLKVPVIDVTKVATVIHQSHDYSHLQRGKAGIEENLEARRNSELVGGRDYAFGLDYATLLLTPQGLRSALTLRHFYFRMRAMPLLHPSLRPLLGMFKILERTVNTLRSMWGVN
ncbi:hypothetical protein ACFLWG_01170 [Chloroflexota bacterium]